MSLKDEMLKAGLITEKDVKRLEHEKRVRSKKEGPQGREQRAQQAREEARRQAQAHRAHDQRLSEERRAQRDQQARKLQEEAHRRSVVEAAYRDGMIAAWEGGRRYYFANGKRIDFLMVTEEMGRKLESGQAAIVAGPGDHGAPTLLTSGAARKLREVSPALVLTFHG